MKPDITLTQMEEEPETGFFGLTFTEVKGAFLKSFLVIIVVAGVASFFVQFFIAVIIGMVVSPLYFLVYVRTKSGNRADKPLYYHRHLSIYKNKKLIIQPAKTYQLERNNNE